MPRGLASAVRAVAPPGKLAEFYLAVFAANSDLVDEADRERFASILNGAKVTLADRLKAGEWLSDRGYGKAPSHAPIDGENPLELDSVARRITELVNRVDELAARRPDPPAGDAAPARMEAAS